MTSQRGKEGVLCIAVEQAMAWHLHRTACWQETCKYAYLCLILRVFSPPSARVSHHCLSRASRLEPLPVYPSLQSPHKVFTASSNRCLTKHSKSAAGGIEYVTFWSPGGDKANRAPLRYDSYLGSFFWCQEACCSIDEMIFVGTATTQVYTSINATCLACHSACGNRLPASPST